MHNVWNHALESVRNHGSAVLVVVVDHTGSVPGTTGATMAVSASGCIGTVGGGVAEHDAIDRARNCGDRPDLIDIEHTPDGSGSLCSGVHTLAFAPLTRDDLGLLESIVAALENKEVGALHVADSGLSFEPGRGAGREFVRDARGWRFTTTLGRLDTLYIFGGGHVALALSRVMATLPFQVVVLDDRTELATMSDNVYADELRVVDYAEADRQVVEGDRSWVVVMTYGHRNDAVVLRRLLGLDLRYLGLLGSTAKVQRMFARFRDDGVPQEQLDRVSAPVGLGISSHTPEEIAISIAAEIVQLKNRSE
jgi:xanthine dehydrogenase accessory factor